MDHNSPCLSLVSDEYKALASLYPAPRSLTWCRETADFYLNARLWTVKKKSPHQSMTFSPSLNLRIAIAHHHLLNLCFWDSKTPAQKKHTHLEIKSLCSNKMQLSRK